MLIALFIYFGVFVLFFGGVFTFQAIYRYVCNQLDKCNYFGEDYGDLLGG